MPAILYNQQKEEHPVEGVALCTFSIIRSGDSPSMLLRYSEGYYDVNNDCGCPKWVEKGSNWSRSFSIADTEVQTLLAKYEIDLMALDDKLVAFSNEYMDTHVFNPPATEETIATEEVLV